jgi:hypothetical protein
MTRRLVAVIAGVAGHFAHFVVWEREDVREGDGEKEKTEHTT